MDDERRDHGRFQRGVVGQNPWHGAAWGGALSDDARERNEIATFWMADRSGHNDNDVLKIGLPSDNPNYRKNSGTNLQSLHLYAIFPKVILFPQGIQVSILTMVFWTKAWGRTKPLRPGVTPGAKPDDPIPGEMPGDKPGVFLVLEQTGNREFARISPFSTCTRYENGERANGTAPDNEANPLTRVFLWTEPFRRVSAPRSSPSQLSMLQ